LLELISAEKSGKANLVFISDALREQIGLDQAIATVRGGKKIKDWVFHDLRRTARSLMSRCTNADTAERVLGHAIPGIRGFYDHHDYAQQKREALIGLANMVQGIVNPRPANVVKLEKHLAS
jgi:integrase